MSVRPLSFHHLNVLDLTPVQLVRTAASAGYQHVCVFTQGLEGVELPIRFVEAGEVARETRAALTDAGMSAYTIEFFFMTPTVRIADYRRTLEIGCMLGGTRATVLFDDPEEARAAENFAKFAELARELGIVAGIEFMPYSTVRSFEDAMRVVQSIGGPAGSIFLDALHFIRSGSSLAALQAADAALIGDIQLCDGPHEMAVDARYAEATNGRLPPGEGSFPLGALLARLPDGRCASIEAPNDRLRVRAGDDIRWARRLLDAARSAEQGQSNPL